MNKLSRYCDVIHLPSTPSRAGLVVLYSYRTGAQWVLEEATFDSLWAYLDQFPEMRQWGLTNKILVDETVDELVEVLDENSSYVRQSDELYRIIMPTAQCSLGCTYCGQAHSGAKLEDNHYEQIVDEIESTLSLGNYKRLTVAWFGAEPLQNLRGLRDLSGKLMQIANARNVHYSAKMATNGLKLTAKVANELINELGLARIEVTLDGPRDIHNSRRSSKQGSGTFDVIIKNLDAVVATKPPRGILTVRCNVDESNADHVSELICFLGGRGWGDLVSIYFASVHSWGHFLPLHKDASWLAPLEIEWRYLAHHFGIRVGSLPQRKYVTCMATNPNARLYDPYGKVQGCTELPLVAETHDHGLRNYEFSDFSASIGRREVPCSQCKMLPICGGSCPKQWFDGNIPCPTFKFNAHDLIIQQLCGVN